MRAVMITSAGRDDRRAAAGDHVAVAVEVGEALVGRGRDVVVVAVDDDVEHVIAYSVQTGVEIGEDPASRERGALGFHVAGGAGSQRVIGYISRLMHNGWCPVIAVPGDRSTLNGLQEQIAEVAVPVLVSPSSGSGLRATSEAVDRLAALGRDSYVVLSGPDGEADVESLPVIAGIDCGTGRWREAHDAYETVGGGVDALVGLVLE